MKTANLTALLFLLAISLSASTIQFVNPGSGANNGSVYVGPYNLLEDGTPIQGTCITWDLIVGPPFVWDAQREYLSDFTEPQRTKLLEAEWLTLQFIQGQDWAPIHQAIWDIFGAGYTDSSTLSWERQAQQNYGSVDPYGFYLLVPNPVDFTQSFIVQTPEPATLGLIGLALIGVGWRKRYA
jgi:hypothetical protein